MNPSYGKPQLAPVLRFDQARTAWCIPWSIAAGFPAGFDLSRIPEHELLQSAFAGNVGCLLHRARQLGPNMVYLDLGDALVRHPAVAAMTLHLVVSGVLRLEEHGRALVASDKRIDEYLLIDLAREFRASNHCRSGRS